MTVRQKPLSPFMLGSLYRWQYTTALSILNRVTGLFLTVGLVLFVSWLIAVASGIEAYDSIRALFASTAMQVLMFLWILSFFYHFANGIRHLIWDLGYGLERPAARASGWSVLIISIVLSGVFWWLALSRLGGAA